MKVRFQADADLNEILVKAMLPRTRTRPGRAEAVCRDRMHEIILPLTPLIYILTFT